MARPKPPEKPVKPVRRPVKPQPPPTHEQEIQLDADRWSGFRDSFGEREVGIDKDGSAIELLRLIREFTEFEALIAERVGKLKEFERPGVARPLRLEQDDQKRRPRLVLVSERVPGLRLSELLTRGISRSAVPDIGAALFVMRRLFAAAESLRKATGISHIIVAPERVLITPRAEVVIMEAALGSAVEASIATGTWPRPIRLANADASPERDGHRIDVARIARIGIAMMLGRALDPGQTIDALSPVLSEISEVGAIRAGDGFVASFATWLEHAITIDPDLSFPDFHQAGLALARVETPKDCVASRATLRKFLADLALDDFADADTAALEADRIREIRVRQTMARPPSPEKMRLARVAKELGLPHQDEALQESPAEIAKPPAILGDIAKQFGFVMKPRPEPETPPPPPLGEEPAAVEQFTYGPPVEEKPEPEPVAEVPWQAIEEPPPAPLQPESPPPATWQAEEPMAPAWRTEEMPVTSAWQSETIEESPATTWPAADQQESAWRVEEPASPSFDASQEPLLVDMPSAVDGVLDQPEAIDLTASVERIAADEAGVIDLSVANELTTSPEETAPVTSTYVPYTFDRIPTPPNAPEPIEPPAPPQGAIEQYAETYAPPPVIEEPVTAMPAFTPISEEPPVEAAPVVEPLAPQPVEEPPKKKKKSWFRFGRRSDDVDEPPPPPVPAWQAAPLVVEPPSVPEPAYEPPPPPVSAPSAPVWQAPPSPAVTPAPVSAKQAAPPPPPEPEVMAPPPTIISQPVIVPPPPSAPRTPVYVPPPVPAVPPAASASWNAPTPVHMPSLEIVAPPPLIAQEQVEEFAGEEVQEEYQAEEPAETASPEERTSWIKSMAAELGVKRPADEQEATSDWAPKPPPSEWTATPPASDWAPTPPAANDWAPKPPAENDWAPKPPAADNDWAPPPPPSPAAPAPTWQAAPPPPAAAQTRQPVAPKPPAPSYGAPAAAGYQAPGAPAYQPAASAYSAPSNSSSYSLPSSTASSSYHTPAHAEPPPQPIHESARMRVPTTRRSGGAVPAASNLLRNAALLVVALAFVGGGWYLYLFLSKTTAPGTLTLESNPRGAEVWIDGASKGVTPISLQLPPGNHSVELRRRGVVRELPAIEIASGQEVKQSIDLTNVRAAGTLNVKSNPTGAKVLIDGKPRGVTPLTLSDMTVGSHRVTIESPSGSVTRDVQIQAGGTANVDEGIFSGWIAVFAPFPLQVFERKKPIGTTENERLMLSPGRHELEFVNTQLQLRDVRTVEVKPGETVSVNIGSAEQTLQIAAPEGAEITIDGERAGVAPLEDRPVRLGSHEIVVKHPQLGDKTVTAVVTSEKPVAVTITLP